MSLSRIVILGCLLASLIGGERPASAEDSGKAERWRPTLPLGLDLYLPVPEDNLLNPEKVALGRKLFSDPILSRDKSLSCATCHDPDRAFTDGRKVSVGVFGRIGLRNVPTLINRVYGTSFFWDGRTSSLEEQVLKPIQDPKEMDMTLDEVTARLAQETEYRQSFQRIFAGEVTSQTVSMALASYLRTILIGDAPLDRYRYSQDERQSLSQAALAGMRLFHGKANCTRCHLGSNLTDERFHNTGVAWRDNQFLDLGRFLVTGKQEHRGAFKTPTLREITRTAPYMHDGSIATLNDVVDFYSRGGNPNPSLDRAIKPLNLSPEEKAAIVAFLKSLSKK